MSKESLGRFKPREKGPVEILCDEIGFRFDRPMEKPAILIVFVRALVGQVAQMRETQESIKGVLKAGGPSEESGEVLRRTEAMLALDPPQMVEACAELHNHIHVVAPDDAYPCDHLIDMLSSCVSAIRFGLDPELPCRSRHAAAAADHVWKHRYGIRLFDEFTPAWRKDWACAQLQRAITGLALRVPAAHEN